jgi:mono/diheme cytochrome c family protein
MIDGAEADGLPFAVTYDLLRRGQERYNIFCSPCHSRVGNGKGMIVQRGYYPATNFHTDRLRHAPLGHFFSVITNGYGAMPDYAAQISPQDRWAIVAYIRALQLSQNATDNEVAHGERVTPMNALAEQAGFSKDFLGAWVASPSSTISPVAASVTAAQNAPSSVPGSPGIAHTAGASTGGMADGEAKSATQQVHGNAESGKTIYAANCSVCHQPTRAGMPPVFPSLLGVVDRVGESRVRTVARIGIPDAKPPMPPHPNLTDKDITDLISYLKTK